VQAELTLRDRRIFQMLWTSSKAQFASPLPITRATTPANTFFADLVTYLCCRRAGDSVVSDVFATERGGRTDCKRAKNF
jgi:hypothetical protein